MAFHVEHLQGYQVLESGMLEEVGSSGLLTSLVLLVGYGITYCPVIMEKKILMVKPSSRQSTNRAHLEYEQHAVLFSLETEDHAWLFWGI